MSGHETPARLDREAAIRAQHEAANRRALERIGREARDLAHTLATVELEHRIEMRRWELSAYDTDTLEVAAHLFEPALTAYEVELARRQRLEQSSSLRVPVRSARSEAIGELAAMIRERVELADLLEHEGVAVQRQRGTSSAHAPCLLCGGCDRFVIWDAPGSRGWCRQCDYRGDVLAIAQTLWRCGFPEAVERLATDYLAALAGAA